jgi:hypothetical protein
MYRNERLALESAHGLDARVKRSAFRLCLTAIGMALVVVSAPAARAGSCTDVQAVHTRTVSLRQTSWNEMVTIPKFDPASGSLCFVVVRMSANYEAAVIAQNLSNTTAMLTATINDKVQITGPAPVMPFSHTESIINSSRMVGAFNSTVWSIGSTTFTMPDQLFDGAMVPLGNFIAGMPGETLNFDASGLGDIKVGSNTGNVKVKGATLGSATIQVTYFTPEPGTLSLLALGLILAGRRRRPRG